jgi:hypothetical protein
MRLHRVNQERMTETDVPSRSCRVYNRASGCRTQLASEVVRINGASRGRIGVPSLLATAREWE